MCDMRNKLFAFGMMFMAVAAALTATFWFARETHASVDAARPKSHEAAPAITAVSPNAAPNDLDTPIIINGTGKIPMVTRDPYPMPSRLPRASACGRLEGRTGVGSWNLPYIP
jgi:hypothetical protein